MDIPTDNLLDLLKFLMVYKDKNKLLKKKILNCRFETIRCLRRKEQFTKVKVYENLLLKERDEVEEVLERGKVIYYNMLSKHKGTIDIPSLRSSYEFYFKHISRSRVKVNI